MFIVFFYYINSVRPNKLKNCTEKGLGNYIIPAGLLKNIRKMVEQENLLKSLGTQKYNSKKNRIRACN